MIQHTVSLDIIIPTYKRRGPAAGLVAALLPQLGQHEKIIIVWQDPTAPSVAIDDRVTLIRSQPPNLPRARNVGLKAAQSDVVLYLDDDVVVDPHVVERHKNCYHDTSIGAVGGHITDSIFADQTGPPSVFDASTGECIQNFSYPQSCFTISVMGANMSFRRSALSEIGGFDTGYKANALWEEVDCSFRFRARGYRIWYESHARVEHLRKPTGGCRNHTGQRYLFHQFANTAYFACRFAPRGNYRSWMRFWKYRLEYLSRKSNGAHSVPLVAAGIAGACIGILRYVAFARKNTCPSMANVHRTPEIVAHNASDPGSGA